MNAANKVKEAYRFTKIAVKRLKEMYPPPLKVLDVGTRDGYSLHLFKKYGYDADGVEIDQNYVDFCVRRGYDVIQDDFQNTKVSKKYDLIYSSHAIEHCDNPIGFIESAWKILSNNGILFIYFPLEHERKKHKNDKRDDSMKHRQFWPTIDNFRDNVSSKSEFKELKLYVTRHWNGHTEALFIGQKGY